MIIKHLKKVCLHLMVINIFFSSFFYFSLNKTYGNPASPKITSTQQELKKLDQAIVSMENHISKANTERTELTKQLASTEKLISTTVEKKRTTENDLAQTEKKIQQLSEEQKELVNNLTTQQSLLSRHITHRYAMGEYQPLKWLINQNDLQQYSRLLTYYHYLIQKRQKIIKHIHQTKIRIIAHQKKLTDEYSEKQKLQIKLASEEAYLTSHKQRQTALIDGINHDIKHQESTLTSAKKNRANLTELLKRLAVESQAKQTQPFPKMRRKLPHPVMTTALRNERHGLSFIAKEGTSVTAVSSGKIVFSNWLNGYGLLIIIDHGSGFMTLYAHNQAIFKHKGQYVQQGETIGNVGHSGGGRENRLYFEIRYRGKTVSARAWLA